MPHFFDAWNSETGFVTGNNIPVYPFLDNKHQPLQILLNGLQDTFVVFTIELLNGQYITQFQDGFNNIAKLECVPSMCFPAVFL